MKELAIIIAGIVILIFVISMTLKQGDFYSNFDQKPASQEDEFKRLNGEL